MRVIPNMLIMLGLMLMLMNLGRIRHIDVRRVRHKLGFLGVHPVFLGPDGGCLVGAAVGDAAEMFGIHAGAQGREGEEGEDEFHFDLCEVGARGGGSSCCG